MDGLLHLFYTVGVFPGQIKPAVYNTGGIYSDDIVEVHVHYLTEFIRITFPRHSSNWYEMLYHAYGK